MEIKVYTSPGLIEWHTYLDCGGAMVPLHFKGGSITADGLSAGRFTTNDPDLQRIIENSVPFERGMIRLVNTIKVIDGKMTDNENTEPDDYDETRLPG